MWFLVCSIPEGASAHMRTRSPGYQILHGRDVKQGPYCGKKREKHVCMHKTTGFFFPAIIYQASSEPTAPQKALLHLSKAKRQAGSKEQYAGKMIW